MEMAAELWVLSLAAPWWPLESRSPSRLKRMALQGERPGQGQSGDVNLGTKGSQGGRSPNTRHIRNSHAIFFPMGKSETSTQSIHGISELGQTHRKPLQPLWTWVLEAEPTRQGVRVQNRLTGPTAGHVLRGEGHQVFKVVSLRASPYCWGRAGGFLSSWSKRTWGPAFWVRRMEQGRRRQTERQVWKPRSPVPGEPSFTRAGFGDPASGQQGALLIGQPRRARPRNPPHSQAGCSLGHPCSSV